MKRLSVINGIEESKYKHLSTVNTGLQLITMEGIDSIGAGKGKAGDMGVYGTGASDVKVWLGDNPTITNIMLKLRQKMTDDSVVITTGSEDQGCISFEVRDIDSEAGCIFRRVEELENGTCRKVNVALPKKLAVSAKVIIKCFKTKHKIIRLWQGSKVDPTKFGAYRAVKMLMEHCSNQPGITTEDKDALRKGLTELADNCLLLEPSDLFKFFSERATLIAIDLMERPVDSIAKITKKPLGKLLMHFLVVLKFEGGISIVVEKVKRPCFNRNVGIGRLVGLEEITPRIPSIKLIGVEVQVRKLDDLMKKLDTGYSLWSSNCWGFASTFAEAVVELLIENVAANSPDKDKLKHGLDNLIKAERPSPCMCLRLIFSWAVFDDKNNDTQRRLENRLEDHLKNCPNCHFRKKLMEYLKTVRSTDATGILMIFDDVFFPPNLSESMDFIRMC